MRNVVAVSVNLFNSPAMLITPLRLRLSYALAVADFQRQNARIIADRAGVKHLPPYGCVRVRIVVAATDDELITS
jgi:hypothetical protein